MDHALRAFMRLCDIAIGEADRVVRELQAQGAVEELQSVARLTLKNLQAIKESAVEGRIHRPSDGAGLGLTREVGEWASGTQLFGLVTDVEMFYRYKL
jgi:hypothetical protein